MDPDVRSNQPGTCRRCGMKLREGIPEPVEFHMNLALNPRAVKPNQTIQLKFSVHDPWKDRPVKDFQIVHEKLFHMFVVSQDLQFFVHDHPVIQPDGDFLYNIAFPKPGMYRVLGDFYPDGATPQLIAKTVIVAGTPPPPAALPRDYSTKQAELQVEIARYIWRYLSRSGSRTQDASGSPSWIGTATPPVPTTTLASRSG